MNITTKEPKNHLELSEYFYSDLLEVNPQIKLTKKQSNMVRDCARDNFNHCINLRLAINTKSDAENFCKMILYAQHKAGMDKSTYEFQLQIIKDIFRGKE